MFIIINFKYITIHMLIYICLFIKELFKLLIKQLDDLHSLSKIFQTIFVVIQIHFLLHLYFLLLFSYCLMSHFIYELVYISILDIFFFSIHYIFNILVQNIHSFFLSHEFLHCFSIILTFQLITSTAHNFSHTCHNSLH